MLETLVWLTAAFWTALAACWALGNRSIRQLPALPTGPDPRPRSVSVVVAARNECRRVETTVTRLLAQRGVDLQVVVVDDRSDDGTTEILGRLGRHDARLVVVRIDELPGGWIGKCHALQRGAAEASGEWILFTDADAWIGPDVVARAVAAAEACGADQLCLFPSERVTSLSGRTAHLAFSSLMIVNAARVNRDRWGSFVGIGAFNLVRAEAYRSIGGHTPLRLEICDDMKLGRLLHRAGRRTRMFFAGPDLEVEWSATAGGLLRALEKNVFALLRFSLTLAGLAVASVLGLWGAALLGPLSLEPAGLAAGAGLAALIVPARQLAARAGWGWLAPLLVPLAYPLLACAVVRSAWVTLRRGGVNWRGTFYPLEALRRGVV